MMQNRYKSRDYTHYYVKHCEDDEVEGALALGTKFIAAIIKIKFRCVDCGYVGEGFNHMNFTGGVWADYQDLVL